MLEPYKGDAPRLSSFAPHGVRVQMDHVAIAGQFMDLPMSPPKSWRRGDLIAAYAVFEFLPIRRFEQTGTFTPSAGDDSIHLRPAGVPGSCNLAAIPEVFVALSNSRQSIPWKRFEFDAPNIHVVVEAGAVLLHVGRRAWNQWGWRNGD